MSAYLRGNVVATQRLLAAAAKSQLRRFVYASSSSVYGNATVQAESTPVAPLSPYAMTKVAVERLTRSYDVSAVGLRFFTIYGPRQRPDMAFHRFIERCLNGEPVELIGDGRQVRDFTYVADAVEATLAAAARGRPGAIYNVGGGHPVELRDAIALIAELVGDSVTIEHRAADAWGGAPDRLRRDARAPRARVRAADAARRRHRAAVRTHGREKPKGAPPEPESGGTPFGCAGRGYGHFDDPH